MTHTILNKTFAIWIICLWVAFFASPNVFAQGTGDCGALSSPGQYGPFDYRTDPAPQAVVLRVHFTSEVEALIRGHTSLDPGPDIDYTLRAIPNNHRALISMMRLGEREKTSKPNGSAFTVECWFERAIRFRPDDSIVRMIYSTYLNKNGRIPEATSQLELATTYAKDNGFTHYNIGLHYFDMKNYDKAQVQAHKAIELGFTQTALRDQLQSIGKWTEPADSSEIPATDTPPVEPTK
jgi:hypothetical protein